MMLIFLLLIRTLWFYKRNKLVNRKRNISGQELMQIILMKYIYFIYSVYAFLNILLYNLITNNFTDIFIGKELSGITHYTQLTEQFYYMNYINALLSALEIMLL